jgi:Zn-dependent protease
MTSEGPLSAPGKLAGAGRVARKVLLALSVGAMAFSVWLLGWKLALTLSVGLLVHEFGHASVTWLYTRKMPAMVVIPPFFGLTFSISMAGRPAPQLLAVSMGGIWFSLAVSLLLLPLAPASDLLYAGIGFSLLNNALNLLPIPGLDGGAICLHLIRGRTVAPRVAIALTLLGIGVLFALWLSTIFVWVMMGINALVLVSRACRKPQEGEGPELAGSQVMAWIGAQALTFTVLVHVAWVLLSMGDPLIRIGRVLG